MGPRALVFVLLAAGCQGPRPTVHDVRVAPSPLAGRVRVEAAITNRGRGEGQVDVQIELRDPASGRVVEEERDVELHAREEVHFVADVEAPRADWVAQVRAEYPPQ